MDQRSSSSIYHHSIWVQCLQNSFTRINSKIVTISLSLYSVPPDSYSISIYSNLFLCSLSSRSSMDSTRIEMRVIDCLSKTNSNDSAFAGVRHLHHSFQRIFLQKTKLLSSMFCMAYPTLNQLCITASSCIAFLWILYRTSEIKSTALRYWPFLLMYQNCFSFYTFSY